MSAPEERPKLERFERLTYDDFRAMARDESLSPHEKIGFPDEYREGAGPAIVADIVAKLAALQFTDRAFLDIGPGCGELPRLLIDLCAERRHDVVLVDSEEMLDLLPDGPHVTKVPGVFPDVALDGDPFDAILAYSVLHYVFDEGDVFAFLDRATELLAPGGALLLGDVPNASKRARFFASPAGVAFHKRFMRTEDPPPDSLTHPTPGKIDDAVILALLAHAREAGCDAYVLPQRPDLPLANRREDIVVIRP